MQQEDINFSVFRSFSFIFASGQNEVSSISIAPLLWIFMCPAWGCQTWNFSCKKARIQYNYFGLFCNYVLGNWCLEVHPAMAWLVTSAVSHRLNKQVLGANQKWKKYISGIVSRISSSFDFSRWRSQWSVFPHPYMKERWALWRMVQKHNFF